MENRQYPPRGGPPLVYRCRGIPGRCMFYRGYPFSGFTADGVFNRIRIEDDVGIRDGTDIHIRDGTGLGSRNEEKPTTGKPPEWEWYAQLEEKSLRSSAYPLCSLW